MKYCLFNTKTIIPVNSNLSVLKQPFNVFTFTVNLKACYVRP